MICVVGCASLREAKPLHDSASSPGRIWKVDVQHYQAWWPTERSRKKVTIRRHPGDLFGAVFDIKVLNDRGRVEQQGSVVAIEGDTPYCLVEVKSDSAALPPGARGKWILAVGFWPREQAYMKDVPVYLLPWEPPESNESYVYAEPVDWLDDDVLFDRGKGRLVDVAQVQARFAEPGRSPLANLSSKPTIFRRPELNDPSVPKPTTRRGDYRRNIRGS